MTATVARHIKSIAQQRLNSQRLIGERLETPQDVVRWFGAVQSQDYPAAKWGVAQRMHDTSDAGLDAAFNAGEILRTHILRPTWHFVAPEDLRWLLALTSPRVQSANARVYRQLELDDVVIRRAQTHITKALEGGRSLTRREIGEVLQRKRIDARGQRLAYIMMHAELKGLVCSGPLSGKQHTYALLEERVPHAPKLDRDEALEALARRYFTSHGPATPQDFSWWSGLTVADTKRGAEMLTGELIHIDVDGKRYFLSAKLPDATIRRPVVHMLPNYDEHVVAYRDHTPSLDPRAPAALENWGNALTAHLVSLNGLVLGGWRRTVEGAEIVVRMDLPIPLSNPERAGVKRELQRYGEFLGLPVTLHW
jgi:hypothetical protein